MFRVRGLGARFRVSGFGFSDLWGLGLLATATTTTWMPVALSDSTAPESRIAKPRPGTPPKN